MPTTRQQTTSMRSLQAGGTTRGNADGMKAGLEISEADSVCKAWMQPGSVDHSVNTPQLFFICRVYARSIPVHLKSKGGETGPAILPIIAGENQGRRI